MRGAQKSVYYPLYVCICLSCSIKYMITYYIKGTFSQFCISEIRMCLNQRHRNSQVAGPTALLAALTLPGVSQLAPGAGETVMVPLRMGT